MSLMPSPELEITVRPAGRHLVFSKERSEVAHIFRRVGGATGTWARLVANARSPHLDADEFALGTALEYYVQLATRFGDEEARSRTQQVPEAVTHIG